MAFQKATKKQTKLRMAILGPSGSGKTYTALRLGRALAAAGSGRMAVIDTEHKSASKYAGDVADFDVEDLENHDPDNYVRAIEEAGEAGYDVLVIDSMSHAWAALLDFVDSEAKRSKSGNSYMAWRNATPKQTRFIEAIIRSPCHIIATMRVKTDYVQEKDEKTGKIAPKKIGLAPIQRDGVEYEFDVVGEMSLDHDIVFTKSRCSALADAVIHKPDEKVAKTLLAWLSDGVPTKTEPPMSKEQRQRMVALLHDLGEPGSIVAEILGHSNKPTQSEAQSVIEMLEHRLRIKANGGVGAADDELQY